MDETQSVARQRDANEQYLVLCLSIYCTTIFFCLIVCFLYVLFLIRTVS